MRNVPKNNVEKPINQMNRIVLAVSVLITIIFIGSLLFNWISTSEESKRNSQYSVSGVVKQKKEQTEKTWLNTKINYYVTVDNQNYMISEYAYDQAEVGYWIRLDVNQDGVQSVWFDETDKRWNIRALREQNPWRFFE